MQICRYASMLVDKKFGNSLILLYIQERLQVHKAVYKYAGLLVCNHLGMKVC